MIVRTPAVFFGKMHVNKGLKMPFLFLLIVLSVSNTVNYIYITSGIIDSPGEQVMSAMDKEPELKTQADQLRGIFSREPSVSDIIFGIASNFLIIYLFALYWHLILRSLQVGINGIEATLRVFCYSSVVFLTALIPVSNPYTNLAVYVWWSYLMFTGISEAHEVSRGLAMRGIMVSLFASFIPFIFLTLLFFSA
jgi:hypothetical protein